MLKTAFNASLELAHELDSNDELADYRKRFVISDPDLLYFDGNSLGRLTHASLERARQVVEEQWGVELIRGWNQGWWESAARVGDKIGKLTGAAAGQVVVSDTTSINLFKLTMAALALLPHKHRIITDMLNFPSDLYILQGCVQLLGRGHEIIRIGSNDDNITPDLHALKAAINSDVALVTLSHVVFKSGYLYDMAAVTEIAHRHGALVLWDLSHSVGALPIELDSSNVDLAIGCTYKYLNGGPGAPAFLYVNKSLQDKLTSPISGWWGQNDPFAFCLDYTPAPGVQRFQAGTQPMLSLLTMEAALDPLLEAGMDAIRAKSTLLTEYAIYLTDHLLTPLGFTLGSPRDPSRRGSHISIRHAEGYRINRALIDEMNLIPDFRAPDNIRLGFAPLYTSFAEVWEGFDRIRRVVTEKRYEHFTLQKLAVT
jgi:kynureninase